MQAPAPKRRRGTPAGGEGGQMATSAVVAEGDRALAYGDEEMSLEQKSDASDLEADDSGSEVDVGVDNLSCNPYGVLPLGNMLVSGGDGGKRASGLGYFNLCDDALLIEVLGYLTAEDLARLAMTSTTAYVFAHLDEIWRDLVLERFGGNFWYRSCWKATYIENNWRSKGHSDKLWHHVPIKGTVFSDIIMNSWVCGTMEINPKWLEADNVQRVSNISFEEFTERFEKTNTPVVVTDVVTQWPAFHKWTYDYLQKALGGNPVTAGPIDIPLDAYLQYAHNHRDDRPLYVFDKQFAERGPALGTDYSTPEVCSDDLFRFLGSRRPDYRWLIIGPAKSGSTFHIDPNATSAWNAVITGAKKWVMYPYTEHPPGVVASSDMGEVTTTLSVMEWFKNFYSVRHQNGACHPVEFVAKAGDLVFVPHGWWHIVLNIEESIAITQNYVCSVTLPFTHDFLHNKRDQVSGVTWERRPTLAEEFDAALEAAKPGLLDSALAATNAAAAARQKRQQLWQSTDGNAGAVGSFSFGFQLNDDEEEEEEETDVAM